MHGRPRSKRNRVYSAYRKIRFLAKRGTLFAYRDRRKGNYPDIRRGTFSIITLHSLLFFLIAYVIVNTINLFVTGFTALIFNIPVIVYYYDVDYLIRGIDWTSDSVSGVFSSGPIAMFVMSLFLIILYKSVETETGMLRLLVLWIIFHALARFFGEILAGSLLNKGFGFVILYMFVMDTGKVVLTILGFVVMFTTGIFLTRFSLYSANIYFNDLLAAFRRKFILTQFFLPFFLGNCLIFLIKTPDINYFEIVVNASMILFLIPVYLRSTGVEDLYFDQEPRHNRLNLALPLIAVLIVLLYRVILGFGIRL